jgi:Protein of unknown function (DUF3999)
MKRFNNRSAAVPIRSGSEHTSLLRLKMAAFHFDSHGVAADGSPRREPWVCGLKRNQPRQGRQKTSASKFFRSSAARSVCITVSHGFRRGLTSAAAPQLLFALLAFLSFSLHAATLPSDWQHEQPFNVTATGLIKLSLPVETLDAARAGLEDLRLYDDAGNEVPYLIERPVPTVKLVQVVKSFQVSMQARSTVITIETGLNQPLDTVTLETPAMNFLKPVRVEGSTDGSHWQVLAQGQPVFRQANGASRLQVSFTSGVWASLRLTVDDQRFAPIPFTGARVHVTVIEPAPSEWMPVAISERHENPGETRLALNLGAANLSIASLQIETGEPLFTRQVTLAVPQISEDSIREQTIGQGTIYRVAVEGQSASDNLSVPLEGVVRSRELLLFIKNQDSPPLPIEAVRAGRRPVYLVFLARQAGTYHLLTGNSRCAAPRYDLAALGMNLKSVTVAVIKVPPPAANSNYRPPEVLPGIEDNSTPLDVTEWKYRKPVKLARAGAQQLELDLEVLAHAQSGFGDLRLLREGRQVPYVLEHTSISRALMPTVTATNDVKDPTLSRWIIKLPQPNLPVTRLMCVARTVLFERQMTLYEELADERGEKFRRGLGGASWVQTPNRASREFVLELNGPLQADTLFLETRNGDNPPIELENFQLFHPVSRVLFKAKAGEELFLYYGNPRVAPPRYDLSLVADQLLTADKTTAALSAQDQLKKSSWRENQMPGKGGVVFWGILAVVVVVLLVIISRLLPKASPPQ